MIFLHTVIWFYAVLSNTNNFPTDLSDLTRISTPGQSGPGSNDDEGVIPHCQELQN